jgi:hypothetical protein
MGVVILWSLAGVLALLAGGTYFVYWRATTPETRRAVALEAREAKRLERARIAAQPGQIICPHCQTRGQVERRLVRRKKGLSGGKTTGAVLTGGTSLLLTGLSRKETATEMHCRNCGTTWNVA